MRIETERLELISLNEGQLEMWIKDIPSFERELGCKYKGEPTEGIFRDIVSGQLEKVKADAANAVWHSFFLIVRKSDGTAMGSADFKGLPDENKTVEIGYGLSPEFEHNGYMTETVRAMCEWAFLNGAKRVTAETEADNAASRRVLIRCGFKEYKADEPRWFYLDKEDSDR